MTIEQIYNLLKENLSLDDTKDILKELLNLDTSNYVIHKNEEVSDTQIIKIKDIIKKRQNGVPIQYLLNKWSFKNLDFYVGEGVLIPRDDTEVVLDCATNIIKEDFTCVDLCSGSGIIGITLKKIFPNIKMYAIEKSEDAFSYLEKNIKLNNVNINTICDDINICYKDFADDYFDLVISNPPYIKSDEIDNLQIEISHEPRMALDGGTDGLNFYRSIIGNWTNKIKSGGYLALEIGENQYENIEKMLISYEDIKYYKDIQGIKRAILVKKL